MSDCKSQPLCKLGHHTRNRQIAGGAASCVPSTPTGGPSTPSPHKIMIVVKTPDQRDYDIIGHGRNVDKLKDLLSLATIDPREVYVTGLVKCAPPKRPPSVQEIKACMGHLATELKAVDPDVVVLMGSDSLRAFNLMGEGGVNALHGKIIEKAFPHDDTLTKTFNVVVSTDPNALFMNPDPKLESKLVKDLRVAKSVVKGWAVAEDSPDTEYKLIDSLDDLTWMIEKIKAKGVFSFDTESRSLPWSKEPLICMQFCWGYDAGETTSAVLPMYNHDPEGTDWKLTPRWNYVDREQIIEKLRGIFEDASIPQIAHNIKYDMCVVRKHLGLEVKGFLFDTMLMHHLLWEHPPHDLEYLADLELDTGDYSKDLKKIVGRGKVLKNTYDAIPDEMMWRYGSKDAECTYRLMMLYFPRLKAQANLWELYQEEVHPFIRTLFKAEWYGVKLDTDVIETLTEEFTKDQEELLKSIKAETWPDFNPNAHADVMEAIKAAGYFKDIEDKRTNKGYSTNKSRLMKLAPKFPLVEDIMKHRSLVKLTGTYMNNAKELSESADGRARIGVMIHGTVNGRVSTRFLHQIPRLDENRIKAGKGNLRDMFIVDPGYKMVYGDYCLDPKTRVLTSDLHWKPIEEIVEGDELVGIDEHISYNLSGNRNHRKLKRTKVLNTSFRYKVQRYQITTSDGRKVVASAEHPWLVRNLKQPWKWIETKDLEVGLRLNDIGAPWESEGSYEEGYLAGIFDGEGYVSSHHVSVAQNVGPTLDEIERVLSEEGFRYWKGKPGNKTNRVVKMNLKGQDGIRLLGKTRPKRLLDKLDTFLYGRGMPTRTSKHITISKIKKIGTGKVVNIQTDSHTFFAEGFATHNCQIELVTLAIQSGDKDMLDVFRSGVDIHEATAAAFLECPLEDVSEFNRSIGKNVNFGRTYGSVDGYALMKLTWMDKNGKEHPITEAMVKRGFASLDARFPAVARYFTDTVNDISATNGIHTTRFGRMKRMGSMMNAANEWARKEAERQAVNGSIQSPANSVTVRCLNNMDAAIEERVQSGAMSEEDAFLVITVHDSGAWEVKDEHVEWFVPKLQEIASRPVAELDDFQFTMKVGVGDSWSEAELNAV